MSAKPKFTIETLKWKWPNGVKTAAYRDHHLIRTSTPEEALEAIDFLMESPQVSTYTYTITVRQEEKYLTYFMFGMPCWGGLAKYKSVHGEQHFLNPYLPPDIPVAFPEGEIIYIGINRRKLTQELNHPYFDFILSDESPWKSAFGSRDTIIMKDNYCVFTNMDGDPTVLYSLVRSSGFQSVYGIPPNSKNYPKGSLLVSRMTYADPRRIAGQKPIKISGGSWSQNFGYTRPFSESIFKTSLPCPVSEFGKFTLGSPGTSQDITYFTQVMKNNFGVEVNAINNKTYEAATEAWDFFKKEAENLKE